MGTIFLVQYVRNQCVHNHMTTFVRAFNTPTV